MLVRRSSLPQSQSDARLAPSSPKAGRRLGPGDQPRCPLCGRGAIVIAHSFPLTGNRGESVAPEVIHRFSLKPHEHDSFHERFPRHVDQGAVPLCHPSSPQLVSDFKGLAPPGIAGDGLVLSREIGLNPGRSVVLTPHPGKARGAMPQAFLDK